ncbi:MAG TPA: hypothetical protein VFL63_00985 [Rhodanobacteraceae bacterium]|nr:hypothetical protein [Rhodanobacteraceae bacterium]
MHDSPPSGAKPHAVFAKGTVLAFVAVIMALPKPAFAAPQAKIENCGWLVARKGMLVPQPDPTLKPSDRAPLSKPPPQAKAAYCERDTMMTYVGDQRVLELGLPLVIRSGGREGVLEVNPSVLFNFHRVGNHYLPGRATK